jgi:hypothetical protein
MEHLKTYEEWNPFRQPTPEEEYAKQKKRALEEKEKMKRQLEKQKKKIVPKKEIKKNQVKKTSCDLETEFDSSSDYNPVFLIGSPNGKSRYEYCNKCKKYHYLK